jgi:hypothetical protein
LLLPAFLISIISFVDSISVAQTPAARKRHRIDPHRELNGFGAANIGASLAGGFSRSVFNFDAGAETFATSAFTATGLAIAALSLTQLIHFLPDAKSPQPSSSRFYAWWISPSCFLFKKHPNVTLPSWIGCLAGNTSARSRATS